MFLSSTCSRRFQAFWHQLHRRKMLRLQTSSVLRLWEPLKTKQQLITTQQGIEEVVMCLQSTLNPKVSLLEYHSLPPCSWIKLGEKSHHLFHTRFVLAYCNPWLHVFCLTHLGRYNLSLVDLIKSWSIKSSVAHCGWTSIVHLFFVSYDNIFKHDKWWLCFVRCTIN